MDLIKKNNNKKTIYLDKLKEIFNIYDHKLIIDKINGLITSGLLESMAISNSNPLTPNYPQIVIKYRIKSKLEQINDDGIIEEIRFGLHHKINANYYLKNLAAYKKDRDVIIKISYFLFNLNKNTDSISLNERSYQLFTREKFLSSSEGKSIINRIGIDIETDLNVYLTPEPFFHISLNENINHKILIVENKDTYITIKRMVQKASPNELCVLGFNFDTLIYGEGQKIVSSFNSIRENMSLSYLNDISSIFTYWGDIDISGFSIYNSLKGRYTDFNVRLFKEAYQAMIDKSTKIELTDMEKNQKGSIDVIDSELSVGVCTIIRDIISLKKYIPQEILTCHELSQLKGGM